ncbi:MAG: AAA family ATPase [Chloroflexi bacterium]|nr:AAA family ATPase [Chloroflexota bacterium]
MTTAEALPFGALLRRFRLAAGLTQGALAERAGLSIHAVSDLERGARRFPYPQTVRQLARALRLSAADRAQWEAALPRRAAPAASPAFSPPLALPEPPVDFVGRDRELAALRAALAEALAGRGSLVLIGGEAGVGKTTLAEAVCREAASLDAVVLTGRCYDLSETPPYGPWRELFARAPRAALPPLPPAVLPHRTTGDVSASQATIVDGVCDYLAALTACQPLVLLLDDLHWSDPASIDLLRLVGRRVAGAPLLFIVSYRADEVARGHVLHAIAPLLLRESRARQLALRRLDEAAIDALVAARYPLGEADHGRLVRYLAGRTEGNALFLGEVLRTIEDDGTLQFVSGSWALGDLAATPVPPLLRQVIAGRVARLAPETGRLLEIAAVIGHEAPLAVWAAVSGVREEELLDHAERAIVARLLTAMPDGSGVRFAHALIREAIYDDISTLRRRLLHRQVGEALAATPTPDPDAVAYQYQQAGDPRAFDWLARAGLRAYQAAAWLTAVERFLAAAALPDTAGERVRVRGWLLLGSARLLTYSDNARALHLLDEAEPVALAADDRVLAANIRHARGSLLALRGEIRHGVAVMEQETAVLEALPGLHHRLSSMGVAPAMIAAFLASGESTADVPPAPIAPSLFYRNALVTWYGHTGRYHEALEIEEARVDELARPDSAPLAWLTVTQLGVGQAHAALGHPAAARSAFAASREGHYTADNAHMVGFTLWSELLLAVLPYQADDVAERTRLATEAARAWERARGTLTDTPHGDPTDLPLAMLEGRWAEAEQLARATLTAATAGHAHGAVVALGLLARQQGAADVAWARVRDLLPAGPATEPGNAYFHHAIVLHALAADLALDAGDLAVARDWVAAHGRWLAWSEAVLWQSEHHRLQARLAMAAGDLMAARQHAVTALERASEPRQPLALLAAQRTLGEVDIAAGRIAAAIIHLDAALALADACAAPYESALTLLPLAEARHAAGERDSGRAALAEARATFDRLGARPALARAEALAAYLATAAPLRLVHPLGLTPREVEVLGLVAEGATDAAIADALSISVNTVNKHVASILAKTGTANRTAAAAALSRGHL